MTSGSDCSSSQWHGNRVTSYKLSRFSPSYLHGTSDNFEDIANFHSNLFMFVFASCGYHWILPKVS